MRLVALIGLSAASLVVPAAAWASTAPGHGGQSRLSHSHVARHVPHRRPPAVLAGRATPRPAEGFGPAPIPNLDLTEPAPPEDRSAHVAPAVFKLDNTFLGAGYVYGSSPQEMDDKRAALVPGLKLSLPIQ